MPQNPKLRPVAAPIYSIDTYRAEETLGFLMGRCVNKVIDGIDAALLELGINAQQFGVLHAILKGRARTPSELARLRYQYSAAITYVLDVLEEKNLLIRKRSAQDRRVVELELTREGEALTRACIPLVVQAQNDTLTCLSQTEYATLSRLLKRVAG